MGKKKSKNQGNQVEQKSDGGKKDDGVLTVVLKVDMHCEGCATKIKKSIRDFEGVESLKGGDGNKLTVIGKVDPVKLREMVEQKTKKKVELVSPVPKKEKDSDNKDKDGGGGEKKTGDKPEKKSDDKKSKEPPVTTAVMKVDLHCQGCVQKIRKTVSKTKGYQEMSIDVQKNLVTVKGTMDMKALAESLTEKLRKPVEIVPPKKDGGEKKEKGGGDGGKGKGGEMAGGGDGGSQQEDGIQFVQYGYPNPYVNGYGLGYPVGQFHAPQMFSDENPNACSIM